MDCAIQCNNLNKKKFQTRIFLVSILIDLRIVALHLLKRAAIDLSNDSVKKHFLKKPIHPFF